MSSEGKFGSSAQAVPDGESGNTVGVPERGTTIVPRTTGEGAVINRETMTDRENTSWAGFAVFMLLVSGQGTQLAHWIKPSPQRLSPELAQYSPSSQMDR